MKIRLDKSLKDLNGKVIKTRSLDDALQFITKKYPSDSKMYMRDIINDIKQYRGEELTVGLVLRNCLLYQANERDGEQITPDQAQKRYNTALKMLNKKNIDLSEEDRDIIKKNLMKIYSPLVSGQIMNILNPKG